MLHQPSERGQSAIEFAIILIAVVLAVIVVVALFK